MGENVLKSLLPHFWACVAGTKSKYCEWRRRSRAQCLSACTGVVDSLEGDDGVYAVVATGIQETDMNRQINTVLADNFFMYIYNVKKR